MSPHSFIICALLLSVLTSAQQPPPLQGLRIVVIEGEDAINVIQQKTAVRPVIEVRDRNNLPVSGVTVTFAIQGGQAATFAGGASTFSVVTNAAGQATAAAINPLASGAMQIQVQAVLQGQTALATIAQTNVMTVAQAAGTAGAGGSGAASTGGATGGISNTTVVALGGVAAGGAIAAATLGGSSEPQPAPPISVIAGPASGLHDVTEFTFTASSTDANKTYLWDFGDGSNASGTTARHVYRSEGTFRVTVREDGTSRTAGAEVRVGSLTGRWFVRWSQGSFTMVMTQTGSVLRGDFIVDGDPGTPYQDVTSPLDGTITAPASFTVFQRGECLRTLNGTVGQTLSTLATVTTFGRAVCEVNEALTYTRQ